MKPYEYYARCAEKAESKDVANAYKSLAAAYKAMEKFGNICRTPWTAHAMITIERCADELRKATAGTTTLT